MTCEASQSTNSESSCLGMQLKLGGKPHLMLNTGMRPIANKYREGKLKSTWSFFRSDFLQNPYFRWH